MKQYKMKDVLTKIGLYLYKRFLKEEAPVKYKHGARFYSNTHIDSLIPQFVEIGENFISAPGSLITAHDASTFLHCKKYRIEKVIIGNNVFLGANSVVLPGVTIGDNVIIGAGAIITKDIPSNSVYAGNPAKFICTIDEYITKCEHKNVLYEVPNNFLNALNLGETLTKDFIDEFQKKVLVQYLANQ